MPDINIEESAADIASDLFSNDEPRTENEQPVEDQAKPDEGMTQQEVIEALSPPQSWAKDYHQDWSMMPRRAQEYYMQREKQMLDGLDQYKEFAGYGKNLREAFKPYQESLKQQGLDEVKAVQYLLNANLKLSDPDEAKRTQYFKELAGLYGIKLGESGQNQGQAPEIAPLLQEISGIKSVLQTIQQRERETVEKSVREQVDAFASDPANPYFDDVADEIVKMLNAGYDLKTAYQNAVWANPVTRQKEIERTQTEERQKLEEKKKQEAVAAKKAVGGNVRSRDTGRVPTEPLGSMEDTMREVLAQRRATH